MISADRYLNNNDISFQTEKEKTNFLKGLKLNTLVKVGNSYFLDPDEMDKAIAAYIAQKLKTRRRRQQVARENYGKMARARKKAARATQKVEEDQPF